MANKMLEYCKVILQKISFSKTLFKKEYKKSFKYLTQAEHQELKTWLRARINLDNSRTAKVRVKSHDVHNKMIHRSNQPGKDD